MGYICHNFSNSMERECKVLFWNILHTSEQLWFKSRQKVTFKKSFAWGKFLNQDWYEILVLLRIFKEFFCWLDVIENEKVVPFVCKTHYVWFSWFWSHLKMSKNVVTRLPQRLKSTLFEIFSHSLGPLHWKNSNNVDFSPLGKQCIVPRQWDQNCENHT